MVGAYGLYTHIRSNRLRTIAVLVLFPFVLPLLVFVVSMCIGIPLAQGSLAKALNPAVAYSLIVGVVAVPLAALWVPIGYLMSQWIIDSSVGAHGIQRNEQPRLWNLTENLCISRGLPMPALRIVEAHELNAFASGVSAKSHSITVTTALLEQLNNDELECVLAHELTHIINKDVNLLIATSIVAGVAPMACDILLKIWLLFLTIIFAPFRLLEFIPGVSLMRFANQAAAVITAAVFRSLSALISLLMSLFLSRRREYMADAGAIELTKRPEALISALQKISANADLPSAITAVREMYFYSPRIVGLAGLLSTHPSVEDRIDAVRTYAQQYTPAQSQQAAPLIPTFSIERENQQVNVRNETIAAPSRMKRVVPPPNATESFLAPSKATYDRAEWNALRERDPDIDRLANKIKLLGEKWADAFAADYLALNDKNYLPDIVRKIIADAKKEERA